MYKAFIFLQEYIKKLKIIDVYYDEAGKNAKFPYGVISDPTESSLKYGTLIYFDINIWSNEPNIGLELEEKLQDLIDKLDRQLFPEGRFVIYFEGQKPVSDPEFELIKRKLTFSIRKF